MMTGWLRTRIIIINSLTGINSLSFFLSLSVLICILQSRVLLFLSYYYYICPRNEGRKERWEFLPLLCFLRRRRRGFFLFLLRLFCQSTRRSFLFTSFYTHTYILNYIIGYFFPPLYIHFPAAFYSYFHTYHSNLIHIYIYVYVYIYIFIW